MFYFESKNYLYRPVSEASGFLIVMVKVPFDPTIEYFSPSSQTWQKSECSENEENEEERSAHHILKRPFHFFVADGQFCRKGNLEVVSDLTAS